MRLGAVLNTVRTEIAAAPVAIRPLVQTLRQPGPRNITRMEVFEVTLQGMDAHTPI